MTTLLLPRKYLSDSQMTCWMTNPKRYRREYFEGGRKLNTKYLTFGKSVASAIEQGTYKDILPNLEVIGTPEYEVKTVVNGVPTFSKIDDYDELSNFFQEFKTGKHAWSNQRVQKHEQLLFYATVIKAKRGILPKKCRLIWMETSEEAKDPTDFWQEVEQNISLTGRLIPFDREFDEREVQRMEQLILTVAQEISHAYTEFINEI